MMKKANINCVIVHGCPSDESEEKNHDYAKHWMPWAAKKLAGMGINTVIPLMPQPWQPEYEAFKEVFDKHVITENSILVGHSCGCAFLVRWLGETKRRVRKLILVAPWKAADQDETHGKSFYGFAIDPTIKNRVGEIVMFTSDNEEEEGKRSLTIYSQALGGKIIELRGKGHFTLDDMGTEEFPELISEI